MAGATIAAKIAPVLNDIGWISPYGDTVAVALVVTLITFLSVSFGELIPKQLALRNPEGLAMFVARSDGAAFPHRSAGRLYFRNGGLYCDAAHGHEAGGCRSRHRRGSEAIMGEGVEKRRHQKSEHEMLRRIIRLGDRNVKSIMTHRTEVGFIDVHDSLETIGQKIRQFGHSRYPVIDGPSGDVIGAVLTKEILNVAPAAPFNIAIMSAKFLRCRRRPPV